MGRARRFNPFRGPIVTRSVFGWWQPGGHLAYPDGKPPAGACSEDWEKFKKWCFDHVQHDNNGELINMRTLTIELRFDSDEEGRHDALKDAAMQAAKHLFTQALLISTKRKPQIAMYTSDMFAGQQEIELAPDLTELGA